MNPNDTRHDLPRCIWCGGDDITELASGCSADDERWLHCGYCHRAFSVSHRGGTAGHGGPLAAAAMRNSATVTICIRKIPPSAFLEGVDLRPYKFQTARCYDVPRHVAEVLIDWAYAEPHARRTSASEPVRARRERSDA